MTTYTDIFGKTHTYRSFDTLAKARAYIAEHGGELYIYACGDYRVIDR